MIQPDTLQQTQESSLCAHERRIGEGSLDFRSFKIATAASDPARKLAVEMEAASIIIAQARTVAGDDEEFLSDIIEGETNVFDLIAKLGEAELEDQIELAGIEKLLESLTERKRRTSDRSTTKRTLMASALMQVGVKTHRTPFGTLTVSAKAPVAIVTDEAEIPARFWKPQAPVLDKRALNETLRTRQRAIDAALATTEAGCRQAAIAAVEAAHPAIPGATLSNGGVQLTIRR